WQRPPGNVACRVLRWRGEGRFLRCGHRYAQETCESPRWTNHFKLLVPCGICMLFHCRSLCLTALFPVLMGCSRGPSRFEAPDVEPQAAAEEAIKLYDANSDGTLTNGELVKCPAVLSKLAVYDQDGN